MPVLDSPRGPTADDLRCCLPRTAARANHSLEPPHAKENRFSLMCHHPGLPPGVTAGATVLTKMLVMVVMNACEHNATYCSIVVNPKCGLRTKHVRHEAQTTLQGVLAPPQLAAEISSCSFLCSAYCYAHLPNISSLSLLGSCFICHRFCLKDKCWGNDAAANNSKAFVSLPCLKLTISEDGGLELTISEDGGLQTRASRETDEST